MKKKALLRVGVSRDRKKSEESNAKDGETAKKSREMFSMWKRGNVS
jgi:hypothetical protein